MDHALELQAKEYERRLETLNHAHEQAQETAHTYLTIDKYEALRQSDETARILAFRRVEEKLDAGDRWRSQATGVMLVMIPLAGVIGGAVVKVFFK
jgi:hypothetical protein